MRAVKHSVSVGSLFCGLGGIVESGESGKLVIGMIALEGIISSSGVGQFHEEIEHIILARILSFIVFSVAWICLIVLLVFDVVELSVT